MGKYPLLSLRHYEVNTSFSITQIKEKMSMSFNIPKNGWKLNS